MEEHEICDTTRYRICLLYTSNLYSTADDGIVVYSVDGMEGLTKDTVTLESLDKSNYRKIEFANNTKVNAGDPVYKLVTDESWTLVTEISKETYDSLKEKKSVKVRFTKDNQSLWGSLEMKEINGHILAYLGFDNSMTVSYTHLDVYKRQIQDYVSSDEKYSNAGELYQGILTFISDYLKTDSSFEKLIYQMCIRDRYKVHLLN